MVALENSVRASNDNSFKIIQQIARYNYRKFIDEPDLIEEFLTIRSGNSTFLDTRNGNRTPPSTMILYRKKYHQEKCPNSLLIE